MMSAPGALSGGALITKDLMFSSLRQLKKSGIVGSVRREVVSTGNWIKFVFLILQGAVATHVVHKDSSYFSSSVEQVSPDFDIRVLTRDEGCRPDVNFFA